MLLLIEQSRLPRLKQLQALQHLSGALPRCFVLTSVVLDVRAFARQLQLPNSPFPSTTHAANPIHFGQDLLGATVLHEPFGW